MTDALNDADIKAIGYVGENIVPPVAVVVPADDYITTPQGENPFAEPFSVNLQILVLGPKATNKAAAENIDFLIATVVEALDEWEVTEVSAPGEIQVKAGSIYTGAVVSLRLNTDIEREV